MAGSFLRKGARHGPRKNSYNIKAEEIDKGEKLRYD